MSHEPVDPAFASVHSTDSSSGRYTLAPLPPASPAAKAPCGLCTIRLERLCYRRAWWFRPFRTILATGVELFALVLRVRPTEGLDRSAACRRCIRFRKNAVKLRSRLFAWLDQYVNPLFNRVRDSLLTPEELASARLVARAAERAEFPAIHEAPPAGSVEGHPA
jgi:hypothetical protein